MTPSPMLSILPCLLLLLVAVFLPSASCFVVPDHATNRLTPVIPHPSSIPTGGTTATARVPVSCSTAFDAWEWTANIGAPAALVAGAVLVTLTETREDTAPRRSDLKSTRFLKLAMRFLLLTSFALETVSIFVSTMTGSVLLGHGEQKIASKMIGYSAPLQLMFHHHEFEYLTTQICFLQGLIHWLAAVAVDLVLPKGGETKSATRMNKCLAGWLTSMILWMMAFYNHHLSFYDDYFGMLRRFFVLFVQRYVLERPIRPMSLLYVPSFFYSLRLTWKAFRSPPELDDE
ncbi:expressed unknown protein [Seminavis robusta]|uniref:Uncharacterized protein n=1 Tax=Seminavis robusta TaxID=568900 RepID=A0A9N8ELT0_9STRA|nr:expressed unknown protein [Seminavis robusta]|eukprot:Sro1191_g250930.1 n/a (288) ;mRNA; r:18149-19187